MPVGKIKKLVQEKGFGFISQAEGEDVSPTSAPKG